MNLDKHSSLVCQLDFGICGKCCNETWQQKLWGSVIRMEEIMMHGEQNLQRERKK